MRRVTDSQLNQLRPFFQAAAIVARQAICHRAHCGTVIVKDGQAIGEGYNGPPLNDEQSRTCELVWNYGKKPKYDLTCCIHAEWRAILDACQRHPGQVQGATLYFMRVDEVGNFTDAGEPYCTVCSRLTMEAGIAEFALWNNNGADIYPAAEYNRLSYDFYKIDSA